jgi:hypothetical protein
MKLSKMIFGAFLGFMAASTAVAGSFNRVQLQVPFVANGELKNGQFSLLTNSAGPGKIYVRDVTAAEGDRYPIALRTGLTGSSFMVQDTHQNAKYICGELGFTNAAVVSVANQAPKNAFKFSDYLLAKTPSSYFQADVSSQHFQSISIIKCCAAGPCTPDGE